MLLKNLDILCDKMPELRDKFNISNPSWSEIQGISEQSGYSIETLLLKDLSPFSLNLSKIKLVLLDVDGTLTDGGMYFTENGDQMKKFNTKDGMGIKIIQKLGIQTGIISASSVSGMVNARAKMLGIENVYVGKEEKTKVLSEWLERLNLSTEEIAFVGDDVNDLKIMNMVGVSVCPSDAMEIVQEQADFILKAKGGYGCVREFCEYLISAKS